MQICRGTIRAGLEATFADRARSRAMPMALADGIVSVALGRRMDDDRQGFVAILVSSGVDTEDEIRLDDHPVAAILGDLIDSWSLELYELSDLDATVRRIEGLATSEWPVARAGRTVAHGPGTLARVPQIGD
jgi:hypothetical protein